MAVLIGCAIAAPAGADGETTDELAAMLESPILRNADLPFLNAPAPDRSELVTMPDGVRLAVSPDGRVTYLTEGLLHLLHRKTAGKPCDPAWGTERSFAKVDGAEVVPGDTMRIELPLFPVAALIRKGHYLRLSLAGTDAGWFADVAAAPANWVVAYGGESGSRLLVPMRPWDGE